MNDLVEFLTSQEILFVYLISALACVVCLIVYIVEKNSEVLRRKHNTRELNKLVEQVRERVPEKNVVLVNEPVIQSIENVPQEEDVEMLEDNVEEASIEAVEEVVEEEEELEYTSIEPDQETAKLELKKLIADLEKQEEKERLEAEQAASINEYEDDQEATAIISMDELMQKSKELYESNEATQYNEENQPISIQDLEKQMDRSFTKYDEPFIIDNVVVDNDEEEETTKEEVIVKQEEKRFKSSPIISPIFGIERTPQEENSLALENTADYDKLDEQLQKSNEFIMTLKEFQKNL